MEPRRPPTAELAVESLPRPCCTTPLAVQFSFLFSFLSRLGLSEEKGNCVDESMEKVLFQGIGKSEINNLEKSVKIRPE